jgi:hypothetical protein
VPINRRLVLSGASRFSDLTSNRFGACAAAQHRTGDCVPRFADVNVLSWTVLAWSGVAEA